MENMFYWSILFALSWTQREYQKTAENDLCSFSAIFPYSLCVQDSERHNRKDDGK
jgi:hypothetical protein